MPSPAPEIDSLPQGLVCQTDQWALGALQACAELAISVPNDVAIAGFDDMPASSTGPVPLTTVVRRTKAGDKL